MTKKLKFSSLYLGLSVSLGTFAGTMGPVETSVSSAIPLSIGAYGGYGHIDGTYHQDGNVAQGRFTLGLHSTTYKTFTFGIEAGLQSGNTMRLSASQSIIDNAGGLPVQVVLKPIIDGLLTVQSHFSPTSPFVYFLKGGIAFRQMNVEDRTSSQDHLSKINPEFQAGLGYAMTEHVMISAFYQGIYSKNQANVQPNSVGDLTIAHIPTQQAGFLGVQYFF